MVNGKLVVPRRSGWWPLLTVLATAVLVGCGPTPVSRFAQAVRTIASNTGANADDVAAGLRRTLSTQTDEQLAATAESLASRTSWVDDIARRATIAEAPDTRHLRAMTSSACDTLDFAEDEGRWPTQQEFQAIIRENFQEENLISDLFDAADTVTEVNGHLEALLNGDFDVYAAFVDGACAAV